MIHKPDPAPAVTVGSPPPERYSLLDGKLSAAGGGSIQPGSVLSVKPLPTGHVCAAATEVRPHKLRIVPERRQAAKERRDCARRRRLRTRLRST